MERIPSAPRGATDVTALATRTLPAKAQVVLQAARGVFLANGFSAATTDMIQREAGVSKATVYAHFPNKEALFCAVIEAECAAFTQTIREIQFDRGRLREILSDMARAYLAIVLSPAGLAMFRAVVGEAHRFPHLARTLYLAGPKTVTDLVAAQLSQAAGEGELELGDIGSHAAASHFVNLVRGEGQLECLLHPDSTPSDAQIDQWAAQAVSTFMRAFGKR
ncbi:TetR/AcrR family transcriptional regulator [Stenotrophomonas maltophilia]|uniref:TetR/AcrR family transcriptional regulator n=1 Tax=Stenotrophomonas maltophilia TaxID=40324 RepID=UPI0012AF46BA|nr:TetR/AcrR family transcriptional regulator [Stenotrophomonas maltophilia]QGM05638.1 TetR family transcriptional regulator [Stenotrophomonas maltophilia]